MFVFRRKLIGQSGTLVALLVFAGFYLSPSIWTGYWAEDLYQSLGPRASVVLNQESYFQVAIEHVRHTLRLGRFFPLTPLLTTTVHAIFREPWQYKAYIVGFGILDLLLFYQLVLRWTGRRDYAGFATCTSLGLIQYRLCIDPAFGFFGQMQLMIALIFGSLIALQRSLDSEKRGGLWITWSVILYLCAALLYEIAYPLVALPVLMLFWTSPDVRTWVRRSIPFVLAAFSCILATMITRKLNPSDAYWQRPDFAPDQVVRALRDQVLSGMPLSYFLADPARLFPTSGATTWSRWLLDEKFFVPALIGFGIALISLGKSTRDTTNDRSELPWPRLVSQGLVMAIFPALPTVISPHHRTMIGPGVGLIAVLIQAYGIALILSLGLRNLVQVARRSRPEWPLPRVLASLTVGILIALTYRANHEVARCFDAVPGSPRFRHPFAVAGGGYQYQRAQLEKALREGLMASVPSQSPVQISRIYPHWYDETFARLFYASNADQAFDILPPGPRNGSYFRVHDVLTDRGSGYVMLSRVDDQNRSETLRIFVQDPKLQHPGSNQDVVLSVNSQGPENVLDRAHLEKSGPGWAVYSWNGSSLPEQVQVVIRESSVASVSTGAVPSRR